MLFNRLKSITDIYTAELTFADITCINIQGAWHLRAVIVRNKIDEKKKEKDHDFFMSLFRVVSCAIR